MEIPIFSLYFTIGQIWEEGTHRYRKPWDSSLLWKKCRRRSRGIGHGRTHIQAQAHNTDRHTYTHTIHTHMCPPMDTGFSIQTSFFFYFI